VKTVTLFQKKLQTYKLKIYEIVTFGEK